MTADALHCHGRMAKAIVDRGGGYLLTLKTNRRHWHRKACLQLDAQPAQLRKAMRSAMTVSSGGKLKSSRHPSR